MGNDENLYKNLVILLKIFKNRPNHLSKYLVENNAFTDEFLNKLLNSDVLNENKSDLFKDEINLDIPYFSSYDEMDNYYNDLMLESVYNKNEEEVELEMNEKLKDHLLSENYEKAAKLRDYMNRNNIKIH